MSLLDILFITFGQFRMVRNDDNLELYSICSPFTKTKLSVNIIPCPIKVLLLPDMKEKHSNY